MSFQWYEEVGPITQLEQGDILEKCNIILPNEKHYSAIISDEETDEPMDIQEINAIVLSQSCDIVNNKIDSIIVCPIWPLRKLIENDPYYKSSRAREELRQSKSPSFHLLNKICLSDLIEDFYFVDFHNIYSLPKEFAIALVKRGKRKRVFPPYREHLSQSFACYFMRVGLSTDIPTEEIKNYTII